jgi:hypothetical protein
MERLKDGSLHAHCLKVGLSWEILSSSTSPLPQEKNYVISITFSTGKKIMPSEKNRKKLPNVQHYNYFFRCGPDLYQKNVTPLHRSPLQALHTYPHPEKHFNFYVVKYARRGGQKPTHFTTSGSMPILFYDIAIKCPKMISNVSSSLLGRPLLGLNVQNQFRKGLLLNGPPRCRQSLDRRNECRKFIRCQMTEVARSALTSDFFNWQLSM